MPDLIDLKQCSREVVNIVEDAYNTYTSLMPEMKDSYSSSNDNKYSFKKLKEKMSSKTPHICIKCKKDPCICEKE